MTLPKWLIRLIFRLLYYEMAWAYDVVAWLVSFGQWAAWRRTVVPYLREGPLLDLAHGTGGLMADLVQMGWMPVGLDLSPYMGRIARRKLLRKGVTPRLVRARAQHLPFRDGSFATIVMTFPAEFALERQTLMEAARVLQPYGRLVIVAMGYMRPVPLVRQLIQWAYALTTVHKVSEGDVLTRIRAAGFAVHWEDAQSDGARARLLIATRDAQLWSPPD
ncbi:MAG: class I SAM-dependent methyltransferase [Anaerolineae bacterium]|nr:class I SAM-dependent methyltransferase [Anaerolineae bacterium]MDW8070560.1 class I SAM-dependent methyltransferase [Anaerolineae bacterium]